MLRIFFPCLLREEQNWKSYEIENEPINNGKYNKVIIHCHIFVIYEGYFTTPKQQNIRNWCSQSLQL